MKRKRKLSKLLASILCTVFLFSSSLNVFAKDVNPANDPIDSSGRFEMLYTNPEKITLV